MQCPKCSRELAEGVKFCVFCGTKLGDAPFKAPASAVSGALCPSCGKQLPPGAGFCVFCGIKLGTAAAAAPARESAADAPADGNAANAQAEAEQKGFFQNMMNHFRRRDGAPSEPQEIDRADIDASGDCLHWNILPGQLAVKIDYKTLEGYGNVKGIVIQDGTKALAFANGAYVGELAGGRYMFKTLSPVSPQEPRSGFRRVVGGIKDFFTGEARRRLEGHEDISFVIIRDATFPLLFEYENVRTASVTANRVAVHVRAKVNDINTFFRELLLDRRFVSFEYVAGCLNEVCHTAVEQVLRDKDPEQIGTVGSIGAVKDEFSSVVAEIFPFIEIVKIERVTADSAELEELLAMREELYVSEQKLDELQRRNDYLNRLTDTQNSQLLREAGSQADFLAAMNKIDEQNLLTDDEKQRFAMTLNAQRVIREAKTDDEVQAALADLKKAGILRAEEMETLVHDIAHRTELRDLNAAEETDVLRRQIEQRAAMQQISDIQAIKLATVQNERILDEQKLAWEIEVGNKRIENQLERQRMMDEYNDYRRKFEDDYSDERREKDSAFQDRRRDSDAAFQDSRRRADIDFTKEEQANQLEVLRQAQALRQEREDAEHRRAMEERQAANEQELKLKEAERAEKKDELEADVQKTGIYAGMSAEQIMAANPNLSAAATAALAAKFSNEGALEAQKQINEAQRQNAEQVQAMYQQFVSQMQSDKATDHEQQLQYMQMFANQNSNQMQNMNQMVSSIALGKGQDIAERIKLHEDALAQKRADMDAETARNDKNSEKLQDRMLSSFETSARAVSGIKMPAPQAAENNGGGRGNGRRKETGDFDGDGGGGESALEHYFPSKEARVCPNCGEPVVEGASFCAACGGAV